MHVRGNNVKRELVTHDQLPPALARSTSPSKNYYVLYQGRAYEVNWHSHSGHPEVPLHTLWCSAIADVNVHLVRHNDVPCGVVSTYIRSDS